jgi:hypothetical protein
VSASSPLRLFLDSNVLTGGIVASWGLDKAVLSLCAARICRLVLAEIVRQEVEDNLLQHAVALPPQDAEHVLQDYATLLALTRPEMVPLPDPQDVMQSRHLIRHALEEMAARKVAVLDTPDAFGPGLTALREAFGTVDQG